MGFYLSGENPKMNMEPEKFPVYYNTIVVYSCFGEFWVETI